MTLEEIYIPIQQSLRGVDEELKMRTSQTIDVFAEGKRLRPALLLFSAHAFNGNFSKDVILVASAMEMIHTASLIHDDIVDDSVQRRNKPSLYRSLGVKPAVIFADFLFTQGLTMIESIKTSNVMPLAIHVVRTMCEGQWMELTVTARHNYTQQDYLKIIEKKTASLFACCCKVGGVFRKAGGQELASLYDFGRNFGLVYQLLDDVADLSHDHRSLFERKLLEWGGKNYCQQLARDFSEKAKSKISHLSDKIEKQSFAQILSYIWGGKYAE